MLPEERNAHLAFLRILADAPKKPQHINNVALQLVSYYPQITSDDRRTITDTGAPWYLNRVRFMRKQLALDGYIEVRGQRVLLTSEGKKHIDEEWRNWQPIYSEDPLPRGMKVRKILEEDPLLNMELITDDDIVKELTKIEEFVRGMSVSSNMDLDIKKHIKYIVEELILSIEDRKDQK
jgi:hypothetical protein